MGTKAKGLLKGLRYISQIFEEEEKEMEIGNPTDVKHVAHIGWDGSSLRSPTWMNEYRGAGLHASAPLQMTPTARDSDDDVKWVSQDRGTKKANRDSPGRDLPSRPKASRLQPSAGNTASIESPPSNPVARKSSSTKLSRCRQPGICSKECSRSLNHTKESASPKGGGDDDSESAQNLPNIPKKSRRKKSKDGEALTRPSTRSSKESKLGRASKNGSDQDGSISGSSYNNNEGYLNGSSLATLKEEEVKV